MRFEVSLTPSNNEVKRMSRWGYQRLRQQYAKEVWSQGQRPPAPLACAALKITRYSAGMLDWDNVIGGLKPLIDCLLPASRANPDGLGILADDSPDVIPEAPSVTQGTIPRGKGYTVLEVLPYSRPDFLPVVEPEAGICRWDIPLLTPSNNQIKRMHPQVYRRLRQTWRALLLDGQQWEEQAENRGPLATARLLVIRRSLRHLDWDNAYGGLKPVLDCFGQPGARNPDGLGFWVDDSPDCLEQPIIRQVRCTSRSEAGTELRLYAGFRSSEILASCQDDRPKDTDK